MTAWHDYLLTGFDTETSGVDDDAFLVTACVVDLGADFYRSEDAAPREFLLQPPDGREIPHEATYGKRGTAFTGHGISTEHARAEGVPYADGVAAIVDALQTAVARDRAVTAFNGSFDISIIVREARRLGIEFVVPPLLIDPLVIDREVWPATVMEQDQRTGEWFERDVPRKLTDVCARMGVSLENAHTADADAMACGLVARHMQHVVAAAGPDHRVLGQLHGLDADELMRWQTEAAARWLTAKREDYLRRSREKGFRDKGNWTDGGWPVRDSVTKAVAS